MKLRSLHVRHFKSLDDVKVDFADPITVLVGPNAVGKSNVVDALRFVREAVAVDLDHAVSVRGGIGRVRQFSRTKPFDITFSLEFLQYPERDPALLAHYRFSIQSQIAGSFIVSSEKADWYEIPRGETTRTPVLRSFSRDKSGLIKLSALPQSMVQAESSRPLRVATDQLTLRSQRLYLETGWTLSRTIESWHHSALYPNVLRQPASPDANKTLHEDGKNWASVVKALRRSPRGRQLLERIFEAMSVVTPGFKEVFVSTVGNYLVPKFSFQRQAKELVEFDPAQLSDGTLRVFGILLALYQLNAPDLLIIEEPELTIHPGALGVLADAFKEVGERTQLVITTHSPQLVDHFLPEQIRVVTMEDGKTQVAPIRAAQVEAVKRRLLSMGEFMKAEGLQPEPVV